MKVNKTTIECSEYNENNKLAIEQGVLESYEPSDKIIQEEAKSRAAAEGKERARAASIIILDSIGAHSGINTGNGYGSDTSASFGGVAVTIDRYYVSYGSWSSTFRCWRVSIDGGGYGQDKLSKFVQLNADKLAPAINPAQLKKVQAKLSEIQGILDQRKAILASKATVSQRNTAFAADPANSLIVKWFGLFNHYQATEKWNNYRSSGTRWHVTQEGLVCIEGSTYTREQWNALAELRERQSAEYESLKKSFTAVKS